MDERDEAETALYQSDRKAYNNGFREACDRQFEALLDRTFGRQTQDEFEADMEKIMVALEEATTEKMTDRKPCIGHMTGGILANVIDLSNIWTLHADRRQEFGDLALLELVRAEKFLSDLLDEILKRDGRL